MSSASKQPTLFEVFGRSQSPIVPEINEGALNRVTDILTSSGDEMGKVVLLRSPRAGYGKTLLLQAAHSRLSETFRFLAVEPSGGGRIDGEVVLESVLRQLSEVLPASGGLTEFDLFARRLLALGLKPLLVSGEIPSHDREGALFAIENRPIETFDFHHQQAATAHWTQANFEVLGPRLASELSEVCGCGLRGCAYWIDLLFRYATTPPEKVERSRLLSESVFGDLRGQAQSGSEEQLQSLLALLSLIEPVVLVFDETEGLSNQPDAGLRVAAFVVQLRQACPALTVILSVNEDVWQTGLSPLMPGGLEDRLTEYEVQLGGLSRSDAETLLTSRFGSDSGEIARKMDWPDPISARAVLRKAAQTARELSIAGALSSEATSSIGAVSGVAMPPPLEENSLAFEPESFEEKAERILEPTSSFEAESSVGFEAPVQTEEAAGVQEEPEPAPVFEEVQPEIVVESSVAGSSNDPFAEAVVTTPEEVGYEQASEEDPSPFKIVPEVAVAPPPVGSPEPTVEVPSSPFEAVEAEVVESSAAPTGQWSAESAVEHFAATQEVSAVALKSDEIIREQEPSAIPPAGSAFDAATPVSPPNVSEPTPLQVLEEEKARLESELREKEILAARIEAARLEQQQRAQATPSISESSPFSVSEPVQTQAAPKAITAAQVVQAEVRESVQEPSASPFSVRQPEEKVAPPTASVAPVTRATAPVPERVTPEVAVAAVEAPVQAESFQPAPIQKEAAPVIEVALKASEPVSPSPVAAAVPAASLAAQAESPFAAAGAPVTSPFASSAPLTSGGAESSPAASPETEDVEELLNQFKKRFGQPGS